MNTGSAVALLRRNPRLADGVLVAALAALAVLTGVLLVAPVAEIAPPAPVIVAWAVVFMAPLLARRRFPLTVLVVMTLHFPFYWAVGQLNEIASWLGLGVAVYSAAAYGDRRRAGWVCAACGVVLVGFLTVAGLVLGLLPPVRAAALVIPNALPFLVAWPLGSMMRTLREYRTVLEAQNEAGARQAVLEERVRIARELHDVVAHHVSVMGVQAGVARRLFARSPTDAIEAIGAVETGSRQAIAELQQLVGVLRRHEETEDLAPQPDLAQLPTLVEHMRQAGLPVQLQVEGRRRPLPAGVELSAYRIVQEALTNTLKHAGPARAGVTVRYRDEGLEVEVLDDGRGASGAASGNGGKGLLGMRERAGVHGGRVEAGARPEGGFRVHAVLGA